MNKKHFLINENESIDTGKIANRLADYTDDRTRLNAIVTYPETHQTEITLHMKSYSLLKSYLSALAKWKMYCIPK